MRTMFINAAAACALCLAVTMTPAAVADDEWPMKMGNYWDVGAIQLKDGGGWAYANWLADEWRKNQEFAKSKGWIKDYMVLMNVHSRHGEPDLYLITVSEDIPSAEVGDKRYEEFRKWKKESIESMVERSGNRAEYRTVMGSSLLQEMHFRDK